MGILGITQGKVFVTACNKLIADLIADGSRAEAELKMIESAVPIMPVQAERDVEEVRDRPIPI